MDALGEVLPCIVYIGMMVINGEEILAILVINRVWFLPSGFNMSMFLKRSYFFIIIETTIQRSPSQITGANYV